jgi:hypothetical protein
MPARRPVARTPAGEQADRFCEAYAFSLGRYVSSPSESLLRRAYELGREAVQCDLGVLDIAVAHHGALRFALAHRGDDAASVVAAAEAFFLEALSAFEMVQRGFRESQQIARQERRQAAILRQLSAFLDDASLALGTDDSVQEMLRLVAEQGRELLAAEYCVASLVPGEQEPSCSARAAPPPEAAWLEPQPWPGLVLAADREPPEAPEGCREISASLWALDGRRLGWIRAFNKLDGCFGELDEAILAHLARIVAAFVERVHMYQRHLS